MNATRCLFRCFTTVLDVAAQRCAEVMNPVPPDDKTLVWEQYMADVTEKFVVPVLEELQARNCDMANLCLVALKLVEIAGASMMTADNNGCNCTH